MGQASFDGKDCKAEESKHIYKDKRWDIWQKKKKYFILLDLDLECYGIARKKYKMKKTEKKNNAKSSMVKFIILSMVNLT